ncbi:MAG: phosphoglycerate kinase [Erysipelotrichaceae bacterium]|nr:phosphoglycerate kinase [Erysipelotrichaceae bacterium]
MKKTIKDYQYKDKTVIIRCDLNVPIKNNEIEDDTRINESLSSINYLIDNNAKIIILSHLGKIKTEEDKINNTLYPVYLKLKELLNTNVYFSKELMGESLEEKVKNLKEKEVLLIENTRFADYPDKLESSCDLNLAKYWASLGDIFINDAYGTTHRKHASNVGISQFLPSAIGFLIEKEMTKLDSIMNESTHPFTVIMGGKKISDKTLVIDNLIKKCDYLLLGGGMCFTFLKSMNLNTGLSIVDNDNIEYCKNILNNNKDKLILPLDIVTKDNKIKNINEISDEDIGYDIGPKTIKEFTHILKNSKRVIVNGPMGVFEEEPFSHGTKEILQVLKENNIKTLVGGGDSASAVNQLGFASEFYHISTGGGATLEYLSGKKLPGIEAISDK